MALKAYSVEFHTGRTVAATRARLYRFTRYISHVIGGHVSDTWVHEQSRGYVRCMVQIHIPAEERVNVEAHPYVAEVCEPPKPDLGTLDMPVSM